MNNGVSRNGTRDDGLERAGWLESWAGLVRRRWRPGALVFLLLFVLAAAAVLLARPIYRSDARLRLGEPPPMTGVSPTSSILGLMRLGGDPFANDLELLGSRTLLEGVIADNALNAQLRAPRGWHRDSLFTRFTADSTTRLRNYELEWQGRERVAIRRVSPRDSMIATVAPGEPITFDGISLTLQPWREGMPERFRIRATPVSLAVMELEPRIVVERSRRDANVVDVYYNDSDPALANGVVGSVIHRFIELRTALQRRESGETIDSLRVVADSIARELHEAEESLENWQRRTLLVQPEIQGEAFVERYSEFLLQTEQARYELEAIARIAENLDTPGDTTVNWALLLTHPAFLENETIGTVLSQLTDLQNRRAELLTRRAETSREVRLIDEQLGVLEDKLRSLVGGLRTALGRRLEVLQGEVSEMEATLAATPAKAIELVRRERAIRLLSEIIILTEQRLRQEEMRQAMTFSNVQVIDPPALRYKPVWPRKKLGLAVGLLFSGAFGLLAMVVADRADRTLRRAVQIEDIIGAPILSVTLAGRGQAPALSVREAHAIARVGAAASKDNGRVAIATAARDERAEAIARALAAVNGRGEKAEAVRPDYRMVALPPVDDFAAAAAAEGGAVALVVHYGRTRRDELARSVRLLHTAGATVVGAIVVCDGERQAARLWT